MKIKHVNKHFVFQFRVMEIDRATVISSVQPTMRMQRNIITTLNGELDKIMMELKVREKELGTGHQVMKIQIFTFASSVVPLFYPQFSIPTIPKFIIPYSPTAMLAFLSVFFIFLPSLLQAQQALSGNKIYISKKHFNFVRIYFQVQSNTHFYIFVSTVDEKQLKPPRKRQNTREADRSFKRTRKECRRSEGTSRHHQRTELFTKAGSKGNQRAES